MLTSGVVLGVLPLVDKVLAHCLARGESAGHGLDSLARGSRPASAGKRAGDESCVHG